VARSRALRSDRLLGGTVCSMRHDRQDLVAPLTVER
jgi:hypothetical protein